MSKRREWNAYHIAVSHKEQIGICKIEPGVMLWCDHIVTHHYPYALLIDSHYQVLFLIAKVVWTDQASLDYCQLNRVTFNLRAVHYAHAL